MQTVAVIDYGMGNLHSVAKALEHVGAGKVLVTSDAAVIREADRVVFPGVGAIRDCMAEIKRLGFDQLVQEVSADRPFLGICVGMQALMERSLDLAISAGGFSERLLSRQVLGEGDYRCLVDAASLTPGQHALALEEFVRREHILVSSGGFIGITDEGLASLGLGRRVCASTSHFAALPFLLKGSQAVATIPGHAAQAIAQLSGLALLPCPLALPRYPIELGWRTSSQLEPLLLKVREAIVASFSRQTP